MPESRMNEVALQLLRQSKDHKVSWEETARRGSYRVVFPDVVLTIDRIALRLALEGESHFRLELMNEAGRVVDSLEPKLGETMHPVLSQIFDLAEQEIRDSGINKALEYLKQA